MKFVQPIRDEKKLDEMRTFLENQSSRDALLFTLGIHTAMRIGQLLKLKVSDLFTDEGEVKDHYVLQETQIRKRTKYPLNKQVKKAIRDYLRDYKGNLDHPLFPSRKGNKAITRQQAWNIINKAARQVGLKERIGSHSLRKTFAYHAYMNGTDISEIQQMMNHASSDSTFRYMGVSPEEKGLSLLNT